MKKEKVIFLVERKRKQKIGVKRHEELLHLFVVCCCCSEQFSLIDRVLERAPGPCFYFVFIRIFVINSMQSRSEFALVSGISPFF
jgi:hypothetical protein